MVNQLCIRLVYTYLPRSIKNPSTDWQSEMLDTTTKAANCKPRVDDPDVNHNVQPAQISNHTIMIAVTNPLSLNGTNMLTGKRNRTVSPPNNSTASDIFSSIEKLAATPSNGHTAITQNTNNRNRGKSQGVI